MRLIKIELLNLASLDKEGGEVIDFEKAPLKDCNIFSIVGKTGSGKSTILDAICLALYNRAPRYPKKTNEKNQNIKIFGTNEDKKSNIPPTDSRNILTHGKHQGYSKLTFAANNGCIYRAEWFASFNRTNYGKAVTNLFRIDNKTGKEENDEWSKLPQIIGLDYEEFLRTVLIAQGTFANFLKSNDNERYELLEKLIGCRDLYIDISKEIKNEKDLASNEYNLIVSKIEDYKDVILNEEELNKLNEDIKRHKDEENQLKQELQKITNELGWYDQEEKFIKDLDELKKKHEEFQKKTTESEPERKRLKIYDDTTSAVDIFQDINNIEKSIIQDKKELENLNKKITKQEECISKKNIELKELKDKAKKAEDDFSAKKPHIDTARTIKGGLRESERLVAQKERAEKEAKTACERAKNDVKKNKEAIENAEKTLSEANDNLNTLQTEINDKKIIYKNKVEDAVKALDIEQKKIEGINAESLQNARNTAEENNNDLKDAIQTRVNIKTNKEKSENNINEINLRANKNKLIDDELNSLNIDELEKDINTLRESHAYMTSTDIVMLRTNLKEGKECPLCGSTQHPYCNNNGFMPVVSQLKELISKHEADLAKKKNRENELIKEKGENNGVINTKKEQNQTLVKELNDLETKWNDIHAKHPDWSEDIDSLKKLGNKFYEDLIKANKEQSEYNILVNIINNLRKEKDEAEKEEKAYNNNADLQLNKAKDKKNDAETLLKTEKGKTDNLTEQEAEKNEAYNKATTELQQAKEDIKDKKDKIKAEIGDTDPDTLETSLNNAVKRAEKEVETVKEILTQLNDVLKTDQGRKINTNKNINDNKSKLEEKNKALVEWLRDYNSKQADEEELTVDNIKDLFNSNENWNEIRNKLNDLENNLIKAITSLENKENDYKIHQNNKPSESKENLINNSKILKEKEENNNTELIQLNTKKNTHDKAVENMGEDLKEKQEKEKLMNEWKQIYDSIGNSEGTELRKIAQCYTLEFLVMHANEEIKKFNNRYELVHVKNSLAVRVIDHDRADDIREITSISGGETFIVSLGMALGLSSLSSKNVSFENLFIDEGFGTLDAETLTTVITSLSMLQSSQGKKVGIISHTDTMADNITTQIHVVKKGNTGSSYIEILPQ